MKMKSRDKTFRNVISLILNYYVKLRYFLLPSQFFFSTKILISRNIDKSVIYLLFPGLKDFEKLLGYQIARLKKKHKKKKEKERE